MKSKSFNAFVRMMESDGSLIEISDYKRQRPEEYDCYHTAYVKARNECMKCHAAGIDGYKGFDYMNTENILAQAQFDKTIPFPDLDYEAAAKKVAMTERIQSGNGTHSDYIAITSELYGRG